jgi:hypothetical protein
MKLPLTTSKVMHIDRWVTTVFQFPLSTHTPTDGSVFTWYRECTHRSFTKMTIDIPIQTALVTRLYVLAVVRIEMDSLDPGSIIGPPLSPNEAERA